MSEEIEQNTEVVTESTETPTQDNFETEVDNTQIVSSLDEAKKVLAGQKQQASKKQTPSKPTTSTTDATDYKKQYQEIQKLVGSYSKELGELRKFHKESQPVIEQYKQFLSQQQEQEMLAKYQQDPQAVIKELARREAQAQIAPYQEQMSMAQANNINNSIREQLGSDYDVYAPVMADLLDGFVEQDALTGSRYAQELASNPQVLMQMAAGKIALEQRVINSQQASQAAQTKAQNLKVAQGVGKGNNVVSSPAQNFNSLSLDEMRAALKQQGIIK